MTLKLIMKNARFAVLEISDFGKYYTDSECEIRINGVFYKKTNVTVNALSGLRPESDYEIEAVCGDVSEKLTFRTEKEFVTLNVRDMGAKGDGENDDTVYLQAAVMACPENSRVLVPAGRYKIRNLFLRSGVNIELSKGAVIVADKERYSHPIFPGMVESYDEKSEYNLGTWEGNPLPMFAGIITGIDVHDCCIYGEGEIFGNASHEDWWYDEKVMRGAFRPRLVFLERCKNITLAGIKLSQSPSWTVHPYFSDDIGLYAVSINNPMNSPNTDGIDVESCRNVDIAGVLFTLGDDCIALKSGKLYMGRKYGVASENIHIYRCKMENGHGAVTVGSEMSAGVKNVLVENCVFSHTDRGLRIKTRRGRGEKAVIDDVEFRNIEMDNVLTPFVANCFYFCDPDGKSDYVQNRNPLPVDDRTPFIKRLVFRGIECRDSHVAAAYFLGLPEKKIGEIIMEDISIGFAENAQKGVAAMHVGVEEMCRNGIYAENVERFVMKNVSVDGCDGEKIKLINVDKTEN